MKRLKLAGLSFGLIILFVGGYVTAASTYKNYFAPAAAGSLDNVLYIGGTAHVLSGGTLTIDSGGALAVSGTYTAADGDFSGTLNADTLDVDGDADFAQTLNADTLDVDGNSDFAGTITAHKGVTQSAGNTLGNTPYTGKIDTTQVSAGATVTPGSTLVLTSFPAGTAVEFWCTGTATGTTEDKTVAIKAGSTVIATATLGTLAEDWTATGYIIEHTGAANQKAGITMIGKTLASTTASDYGTGTVNVASGVTLTVEIDSNATGNTITKEACIWKVLPY